MKFNVGDSIGVKNDTTKGVVTKVQNDLITIETTDGIDLNFTPKELILYESHLDEITKVVNKDHKRPIKVSVKQPFNTEVDLHCKNVTDKVLDKQMRQFKTALQLGIHNKVPSMVFIHGVGKGVLRRKIIEHLEKKHLKFSDASYKKYGTKGAIEVFLSTPQVVR